MKFSVAPRSRPPDQEAVRYRNHLVDLRGDVQDLADTSRNISVSLDDEHGIVWYPIMKVLRVGDLVAESLYSAGNFMANNSCAQRQSETIECFNDYFNKTLNEVI